jgi:hypothetical protein
VGRLWIDQFRQLPPPRHQVSRPPYLSTKWTSPTLRSPSNTFHTATTIAETSVLSGSAFADFEGGDSVQKKKPRRSGASLGSAPRANWGRAHEDVQSSRFSRSRRSILPLRARVSADWRGWYPETARRRHLLSIHHPRRGSPRVGRRPGWTDAAHTFPRADTLTIR